MAAKRRVIVLVEFRVENYRSLRDEQVLTLEAANVGDENDPRPRQVAGYDKKLLPVAVLYGGNASGKTNVLAALDFMRAAVVESHARWNPTGGVPRDPFAWGPKRSSLFEVTILIKSVRYQYGFVATDDSFIEEWLYAWPNGRKQMWFERENTSDFRFGEHLKGQNEIIKEVTRPNALFLSAAVQHQHESLVEIFAWFRYLTSINFISSDMLLAALNTAFLDSVLSIKGQLAFAPAGSAEQKLLTQFRSMLQEADIGISDLKIEKSSPDYQYRGGPRFLLKHGTDQHDAWLPLEDESRGTQTLFRIGIPILRALRDGSVVLVDELEASLHPILVQRVVGLFNDPATNPNNAQLLFTTHDTNLLGTTLGEPVLRRDQVWLTEKKPTGDTELYPLTDFKPRKAENLERGYLQGRYGAIPFLGNFMMHSG